MDGGRRLGQSGAAAQTLLGAGRFSFHRGSGDGAAFSLEMDGGKPHCGGIFVWEHMKLLFFPAFLFSMIEVWFQDSPNFLASRGISLWVGTALIPLLFYTYTGIVGVHVLWADIAVFLIAAAAVFLLDLCLRRTGRLTSGWQQAAGLAALWALALVFVLWTYRPPHLPLFWDAAAGVYGVPS